MAKSRRDALLARRQALLLELQRNEQRLSLSKAASIKSSQLPPRTLEPVIEETNQETQSPTSSSSYLSPKGTKLMVIHADGLIHVHDLSGKSGQLAFNLAESIILAKFLNESLILIGIRGGPFRLFDCHKGAVFISENFLEGELIDCFMISPDLIQLIVVDGIGSNRSLRFRLSESCSLDFLEEAGTPKGTIINSGLYSVSKSVETGRWCILDILTNNIFEVSRTGQPIHIIKRPNCDMFGLYLYDDGLELVYGSDLLLCEARLEKGWLSWALSQPYMTILYRNKILLVDLTKLETVALLPISIPLHADLIPPKISFTPRLIMIQYGSTEHFYKIIA